MMKLAFYKAKYGSWTEKLLAFVTGGPYSHVELICIDHCFSSSPTDNGVRFKRLKIDDKWDIVHINVEYNLLLENWLHDQLNKKYDWTAIWHWYIPFYKDNDESWYCSELIATILNKFGNNYNLPKKISVNKLYKKIL